MNQENKRTLLHYTLNIIIVIFTLFCIYLIFSLLYNSIGNKNVSTKENKDSSKTSITNQPNLSIQIDVQNGTGENRIGAIFRDFLKKKGYDVVDLGNYKTGDVATSIVLDRTGDIKKAQRIAEVLGIGQKNISQQINKDRYLDATVIIGKDYNELKPYTENKNLKK
jgi:hypothetical protein